MGEKRRYEDTAIGKLVKLWPIILGLVMVAVAWGTVQTKLTYMEKGFGKIEDHEIIISQHSEALKILPEMREDIKSLLREVRRERYERNGR